MKILTNLAHLQLAIYNTIQENVIFKSPCKFGESKWNPCWLIILTSSTGINYVLNEYEDVDQY